MKFAAEMWLTGDKLNDRKKISKQYTWSDIGLLIPLGVHIVKAGPRITHLGTGRIQWYIAYILRYKQFEIIKIQSKNTWRTPLTLKHLNMCNKIYKSSFIYV